jgi:hypothetical protein
MFGMLSVGTPLVTPLDLFSTYDKNPLVLRRSIVSKPLGYVFGESAYGLQVQEICPVRARSNGCGPGH